MGANVSARDGMAGAGTACARKAWRAYAAARNATIGIDPQSMNPSPTQGAIAADPALHSPSGSGTRTGVLPLAPAPHGLQAARKRYLIADAISMPVVSNRDAHDGRRDDWPARAIKMRTASHFNNHWLVLTRGVRRDPGESLAAPIWREPRSIPHP